MAKWLIGSLLTMMTLIFLFNSSSKIQNDPQSVFQAFLEAEKTHDLIHLIRYSRDESSMENNVSNQIALLSRGNKSNTVLDYKILTKKQIDDTHVEFTYLVKEAGGQTTPPLPMAVSKKNGKWIVDMQLVEINRIRNSPEFEKVTKMDSKVQHNKEELRSKLSPQMTSVAYWAWKGNQ